MYFFQMIRLIFKSYEIILNLIRTINWNYQIPFRNHPVFSVYLLAFSICLNRFNQMGDS